jgi:hypothetical protein
MTFVAAFVGAFVGFGFSELRASSIKAATKAATKVMGGL